MNPLQTIEQAFFTHLEQTFSLTPAEKQSIVFSLNDDPKKTAFGDLSSNAALVIGQSRKEVPRAVAQRIVDTFSHPLIESMTIAGPGFVNLTLTQAATSECAHQLEVAFDTFFKLSENTSRTPYSVEFVSANPTGPLHLGHGRGGIIGDVLGNVLRFAGQPVTKEFYINDAGKQIQTLGLSLKIRCEQELGSADAVLPEDAYHGAYLIELAKQLLTAQPAETSAACTASDIEFFAQYAKAELLKQAKATLASYGIFFDVWFSEKTLHESGAVDQALNLLKERGHTFEQDGALWFRSTTFGDDKDRVLKRSNGEVTYLAADVAYLQSKIARGAQKLVVVLGQDHHSYQQRLKGMMQALGHNPDDLTVILYQLVTIKEEGEVVRLSKRAGRIVSLADVIEEVGSDVARFFYLNRKPDAHLEFDIALALERTEKNPVYYLQYAYVRTNSILQKAATEHPALLEPITNANNEWSEAEKLLLKKIMSLKRIIEVICTQYQPHLLTYYTLELANQFHRFYTEHKVIDPTNVSQSQRRLALITLLNQTFGLCFTLLGISKPERM